MCVILNPVHQPEASGAQSTAGSVCSGDLRCPHPRRSPLPATALIPRPGAAAAIEEPAAGPNDCRCILTVGATGRLRDALSNEHLTWCLPPMRPRRSAQPGAWPRGRGRRSVSFRLSVAPSKRPPRSFQASRFLSSSPTPFHFHTRTRTPARTQDTMRRSIRF